MSTTERTITIKGESFTVSAPFAEGHTLTLAEAAVLNQTRAENLRNNFAGVVEAAQKTAEGRALTQEELDALQTKLNEYDDSYEFQGKRAPRASVDPVRREAIKIARSLITEALAKKGQKVKDLPEGNMDKRIEQVLEKRLDITEEAKKRVESAKTLAAAALDLGE